MSPHGHPNRFRIDSSVPSQAQALACTHTRMGGWENVIDKTRKSCSVSVSCVRGCARERCLGAGVCLESVSCSCWSRVPLPRWCPACIPFVFPHVFHFFLRCHALSSRSRGFGLHSPSLLIHHSAGLTGSSFYRHKYLQHKNRATRFETSKVFQSVFV